ncbi:MAG: family 20 glycosylhydrolase, partial [Burkholderiales bacterium]|nr:family 20 glycosylhydrolase [Burkholderiales bacterium]
MKLNRINAYLIGCGLSLAGCSNLSSQHSTNPTQTTPTSGDLLHIDNITIGHMKNDTSNQFTIKLALSAQSLQNIDGWKIGFFMPRVLDKHSGIANKSLSMTVCEQNSSQCSKLIYQKNSFTANDLSTGFISILAPKDNFTLRAGKRYVITLAHINTPLLNYSSVPQSWFLITPNNQVINLAVSPASYQLIDYNGTQIQRQVAEHNQDNWNDSAKRTTPLNVIPSPNQVVFEQHGQLTLGNQVMIVDKSSFNHNSESFLVEYLKHEQQISRTHHHTAGVKLIEFSAANFTNPEAYAINITTNKILISSNTRTGGFYAVQTLRQIFVQYGRNIPTMTINDAPRFKYRGLMLDSARHYFTPNEIQNLLDLMALQKLNT